MNQLYSNPFCKQSELRFRTLLDNTPEISVQGYEADGTTFYWNKASEVLYGYSKEEAAIRTVESAGRTILYSGTVVSIGLVALLMPNVVFMTSLGLSGLLVVISTIAVGLTLIPALLSLIGPHLNAPQALANWTSRMWGQSRFWRR